jgi:N-acetylneuraminic acid mutarotase
VGVHRFFEALALVGVLLAAETRATVQATGSMAAPRSEHTETFLGTGKVLVAGGVTTGGVRLATAELYDPATGVFSPAAPMPEARNGHTATLLPNGKVLVAGGNGDAGALATCRLFDPRTGTWTATGSLAAARREHTATLLADGRVLVAAGQNGTAPAYTALASAELYDPATGTWAATGAVGSARAGHAAALLEDGTVLVAGGQTRWFPLPALYTSTAYLYDPTTGTWSATGSMGTARKLHTLTRIPGEAGGLVVAAGGRNASYLSSAERYNVSTGTWGSTGGLGAARSGHAAALLPDARILLVGGSDGTGPIGDMVEYDPAANAWTQVETGGARSDHTATLLPGGRVLVVGGERSGWLSDAELVDRADPAWTFAGTTWGRKDGTATPLPNGKVLVLGTASVGDVTRGALFNPGTNTWAYTVGTMIVPRSGHVTVPLADGRVLILGGRDLAGNRTASCEIYDPATDSFTTTPSLPGTLRASVHAVLLPDGRVLAAGNEWCLDAFGCNNPPYVRDPGTGAWSRPGSYPPLSEGSTSSLTLLQNGKVLSVRSELFTWTSRATIFDPGAGDTWRTVCTLSGPGVVPDGILLPGGDVLFVQNDLDYVVFDAETEDFGYPFPAGSIPGSGLYPTATALPDGRVLLVGGIDATRTSPVPFAAVLDPATGVTSPLPDLADARLDPVTAVLPDGRILVSGGKLSEGDTAAEVASSEILDLWPSLADSRRPLISTWPSSLAMPGAFTLSGTGFRGGGEASGGNGSQASPADAPSVLLRRAGGGPARWVPSSAASSWTTTSFPSASVSGLPSGSYAATLWASGLPSFSRTFSVSACELTTGVLESTSAASVCEGQPLSLSARSISGATYLWTLPDGSTSTSRTLSIPNAQVDDGGFYTVVATKNGCTSPPDTVLIRVASGLTAPVIEAPSTMGQGEYGLASVEFHPGSTYTWTLSAGTMSWGQGSNEISFSAPATGTSMTITVVETVGASCVQPSAQKVISLGACGAPTPTPSNTGPYCEGATIQLSTPDVPSAQAFSWEGPNGFTSFLRTPTIPGATTGDSGTYSVRVRVAGCWSPAVSTAVQVQPHPPAPLLTAPALVCSSSAGNLASVLDAGVGAGYDWQVTNGVITSGGGTRQVTFTAGASGAVGISVAVTTAGSCTSARGSVDIPIRALCLNPVTNQITVGATSTFTGSGFTAGSVIKLFVSTASGPLDTNTSGWTPTSWTPTALTWDIPTNVPLGQGFATVQVVNTDEGYVTSNLEYQHVYGDAADGLPTILTIGGVGLSAPDPSIPGAHVETVLAAGSTVTVTGTGFNGPLVNVFTATGNLGPLTPLPGGTTTSFQVVIPADAPAGPGSFQVVNSGSGWTVSNAVDAVLRARVTVTSVSVNGSTVTVTGDGFCALTVINLFNVQGENVVNLGGLTGGGTPVVPLSNVTSTSFQFTLPAGAQSGAAYVMALNPPFTPFTSSGTDPGGAFTVP